MPLSYWRLLYWEDAMTSSILIQMLPWIMRIIYQKKVRCTPVTLVS